MDNPFAKPTTNLPSIDGQEVLRVLQVTISKDQGMLYKCLIEDGTQRDITEEDFKGAQNGSTPPSAAPMSQDTATTPQPDVPTDSPADQPASQDTTVV